MNLTEDEAKLVARRLVAVQALHPEDWLEWESFPELGEHAFGRLVVEIRNYGKRLFDDLREWEQIHGIDVSELIERAS